VTRFSIDERLQAIMRYTDGPESLKAIVKSIELHRTYALQSQKKGRLSMKKPFSATGYSLYPITLQSFRGCLKHPSFQVITLDDTYSLSKKTDLGQEILQLIFR
jgi:hypothetical protein